MTPAQKKLHWNGRHGQPGWYGVAGQNAWQIDRKTKRLREDAAKPKESDWHAAVWKCAEALAQQARRAVTDVDLRHGVYLAALGVVKSSNDFTNADLDRVLLWFRLLYQPEDLKAIADWREYQNFDHAAPGEQVDNPGERRRQMFFIRQTPEAVVLKFLRDRFQGQDLDQLSLAELRQLTTTLKNRRNYNDRPVGNVEQKQTELTEEEMPF